MSADHLLAACALIEQALAYQLTDIRSITWKILTGTFSVLCAFVYVRAQRRIWRAERLRMLLRRGWVPLGCALLSQLGGCTHAPSPPPFTFPSTTLGLSFLDPKGPVAAAQRGHLFDIVLLLLIVVVPVLVLTPIFAWRYRYGGSSPYTPRWSFSWPLEFAVWGIPVAIVIVLAFLLWHSTKALDPYAPLSSARPPIQVEVVGYDWKWLFIYPDFNIASIGEFAFPAEQPLAIDLTSDTIMQSFFIPSLGSQIYAMAGMVTKLHLKANAPGSFRGQNTQYNGEGFQEQKFTAMAMTPTDFDDWIATVRAKGIPLSGATYDAIRQRSTLSGTRKALRVEGSQSGALYFTAVPRCLFKNIVRSFHGGPTDASALCSGTTAATDTASGAAELDRTLRSE